MKKAIGRVSSTNKAHYLPEDALRASCIWTKAESAARDLSTILTGSSWGTIICSGSICLNGELTGNACRLSCRNGIGGSQLAYETSISIAILKSVEKELHSKCYLIIWRTIKINILSLYNQLTSNNCRCHRSQATTERSKKKERRLPLIVQLASKNREDRS